MAEVSPRNRLYIVIGAIAVLVVVGGIILFTSDSAQGPSTAEQPTTDAPAAVPPAATPPAPGAPAAPPAGGTK